MAATDTRSSALSRFPSPHAAQQGILDNAARFNVVVCGRRWGKTELGKRLLAEAAIEGRRVAYLAPIYPMAHQFYREMLDTLAGHWSGREANKRIEFPSGGFIDIWSMEGGADRMRGQKYHRVVLDECAQVVGLTRVWELVVRPTLADYRGDAWFLSTPRRGSGFEEMYDRDGHDGWRSWRMPTSSNPHISSEEIEAARQGSTEGAFAQEWLADFEASDSELVFPEFSPALHVRPAPVSWQECKWRIVGIDPGGGDPTAIVPIGVSQREHIHQYGEFYRRGDVTLEMILIELAKFNSIAPIDRVFVGETNGNILINTLRRAGYPAFKADMRREGLETVRWVLQAGRLTIDPGAVNSIAEFRGYRWRQQRDMETGERYATSTAADNHADAMDARRYAIMGVIRGLPAANSGPVTVSYGRQV